MPLTKLWEGSPMIGNEWTKPYNDLGAWLKVGKSHHKVCVIVTLCAQCGAFIGVKDGQGQYGVSHGLCQPCYKQQMNVIKQFKGVWYGKLKGRNGNRGSNGHGTTGTVEGIFHRANIHSRILANHHRVHGDCGSGGMGNMEGDIMRKHNLNRFLLNLDTLMEKVFAVVGVFTLIWFMVRS